MPALSEGGKRVLWTAALRLAPGTARLDAAGRERFFAAVERALAPRPPALRRQLELFLRAVRWLPLLRRGRPLERLTPAAQDAFLLWLHGCPVPLLRKGFWGLKTIAYLGYYGQPELGPTFGYRPDRDGNRRLVGR